MRTLRSSIRPTSSTDAFQEFTKFCAGKVCWKAAGASTLRKIFRPARRKKSIACAALYPHLQDDEFVREHLHEWLR